MEDDSSERILKLRVIGTHYGAQNEVEDDSSERILKRLIARPLILDVGEVEDDSSERILKQVVAATGGRTITKWKTILQREY